MIGLISCSAQKLGHAAEARELYSSTMFRLSLAHAERHCAEVYVLSALHGLVELDTVLAPYNQRLGDKADREAWGRRVLTELKHRHKPGPVEVLAGRSYSDALVWPAGWSTSEPLRGMKLGARLSWLSAQNKAAS